MAIVLFWFLFYQSVQTPDFAHSTNSENNKDFYTNIASKVILLLQYMYMYMYLLYQGVCIIQMLHTASLEGQD